VALLVTIGIDEESNAASPVGKLLLEKRPLLHRLMYVVRLENAFPLLCSRMLLDPTPLSPPPPPGVTSQH
jgi:hypothetical protein